LRVFDDIQLEPDAVGQQALLIQSVHPDATLRDAAEKHSQKASALGTELSLNRDSSDAINALDVSSADAETRFYVQRLLRDFHLAGVDKDEATRKRIQALRDQLTEIGRRGIATSARISARSRPMPVSSRVLEPAVARKYRESILAPGGSKPAATLVRDFLGRPFDFKAWEAWLNADQ